MQDGRHVVKALVLNGHIRRLIMTARARIENIQDIVRATQSDQDGNEKRGIMAQTPQEFLAGRPQLSGHD